MLLSVLCIISRALPSCQVNRSSWLQVKFSQPRRKPRWSLNACSTKRVWSHFESPYKVHLKLMRYDHLSIFCVSSTWRFVFQAKCLRHLRHVSSSKLQLQCILCSFGTIVGLCSSCQGKTTGSRYPSGPPSERPLPCSFSKTVLPFLYGRH